MPNDQEHGEMGLCKSPTYQALAVVSAAVGGYSEIAVNHRKALLMKESSLPVSPFSKIEAPFASALKLGNISSLLRFTMLALRSQCEDRWKNLIFEDPDTLEQIFQTASVPPLELLSSVLGRDCKKALRLRSVRAVVQNLIHNGKAVCRKPFFSLLQLEALASEVWETTHTRPINDSPSSFWWQEKLSRKHSPLEVVGGEVEICHMTVKALEHFPTIRLSNVGISTVQFNFGVNAKILSGQEYPEQMLSFAHIPALDSEQDQSRLQPVALAISPDDSEKNERSDLISEGDNDIADLDEESERSDDCGPSSDDDSEGDAETQAVQLPNAPYSMNGVNSNIGHARDLMGSRENSESAIGNSTVVARRNDLIEGLIGLGFPPEWAIRCATETNLSINESGAVAWILEQMEKDATAGVEHGSAGASSVEDSGVQSLLGRMFNMRDLTSSRSADDLLLMPSMSMPSGHGMLTLPTAHHGLYPNQGFRSHTEQLSRNRLESFSELQASKQHFANPTARKSVNGETNPFLIAEQNTVILDDGATTELFASRDYTVHGQESFADSILPRKAMVAYSRSISECPNTDVRAAEVETVPLCLTLDSMLSRIYAKQSLYYLLTSEVHLPEVFLLVSRWSSNADSFRRLTRFMRATIGLEKQEPLIESGDLAGMTDAAEQSIRLQKTMQTLLKMEIERSRAFTHRESEEKENKMGGGFPIFHALFSELKSQCAQAISLQGSERSGKKISSVTVDGTAQNVLWTLWISGIISTEVETQAVLAQEAFECFSSAAVAMCYSLPFFQTLVTIASSPSLSNMPWKLAAFAMIKRVLPGVSWFPRGIQDKVSIDGSNPDEQCLQPLPWTSDSSSHFNNQISDILDLFALRYHKEKASRVFFSSLTRVVFGVLVRFLDSHGDRTQSESSSFSILEGGEEAAAGQEEMDFAIESFSSTHATVSWSHRVVDLDEAVEDQDTTTSFANTLLPLSVIQEDSFHGDVADAAEHLPRVLPSKGSYAVRYLMPDTRYVFRLVPVQTMVSMDTSFDEDGDSSSHPQSKSTASTPLVAQCTSGRTLYFQTPPEPLFELDAESMGKNLVLFSRNLSVKNLMNKKWHTVRASVGFDEGIHQWHVRIDNCVSKNIFVGVCTAQASLENYIGSDGFGYGFLANKAVWHNKSKLHSYGEIFKQGDLLQVTLDCNAKTLAFSRNGEYLGIAASSLHVTNSYASTSSLSESATCKWYPVFSVYNKDDQLTIIPPSSTAMFAKPERHQHASILDIVEAMQIVEAYQASIGQAAAALEISKECSRNLKLHEKAFSDFQKWKMGELVFREFHLGQFIGIESSEETARKFGFSRGDCIFTSKGQATVLGECNHELWYEADHRSSHNAANASAGLDSWNLHACKQMVASPSEFPVHRYAKHSPVSDQTASGNCELGQHHSRNGDAHAGSLNAEDGISPLNQFDKSHHSWNQTPSVSEIDKKLIQILDQIASSRALSGPQHLSFLDIRAAFVTDNIMTPLLSLISTLSLELPSTVTSFPQIMNRIGLLLHVNRSLYRVIRLVLSELMRSTLLPTPLQNSSNHGKREDERKEDDDQDDESSQIDKKKKTVFLHTVAATESIAALINNTQWSHPDPSDFGPAVDCLGTRLLFHSQKERLIQEALRKTATPTLSSSVNDLQNQSNESVNHLDDSYDPSELPRMRVRFPETPNPISFKRYLRENGEERTQLRLNRCRLLAKHNVSNDTSNASEKSSLETGGLQEKNEGQQTQPPALSQATRYLQLLERVVMELQSPVFPLFVPALSSMTKRDAEDHDEEQLLQSYISWDAIDGDGQAETRNLELDLNLSLFSPSVRAHYDALAPESVLLWYFQFGQLLGIAWRGGILLPLQFISKSFWEDLLNPVPVAEPDANAKSARRNQSIRLTVLYAIRDGIFSITPSRCLALSTAQELRRCVSDTNMLAIRSLQRHALYSNECAHHKMFWDLVNEFTSLEQRALLVFLTGTKRNSHEKNPHEATEGTQQPFVVELSDAPLSDSQGNPDACYPVVVLVSDRQSRVHMPAYSSAAVMRKKLTQAMASTPPQQF
ncbi:E3 ubiquitin-protein ligase herc1, partial [Globisporangium splendens]